MAVVDVEAAAAVGVVVGENVVVAEYDAHLQDSSSFHIPSAPLDAADFGARYASGSLAAFESAVESSNLVEAAPATMESETSVAGLVVVGREDGAETVVGMKTVVTAGAGTDSAVGSDGAA